LPYQIDSSCSIEGIDQSEFDCIYSPAKRRGPVPGKAGQTRKAGDLGASSPSPHQLHPNDDWTSSSHQQHSSGGGGVTTAAAASSSSQGWNANGHGGLLDGGTSAYAAGVGGVEEPTSITSALQQQLGMLRQLQQRQAVAGGGTGMELDDAGTDEPSARRVKLEDDGMAAQGPAVPRTITSHTNLLERCDPEGSRLYAYYKLSVDEMFRLPTTPTDDEYCARVPGMTSDSIPGPHLAALSAARFAELAIGALVHNEVGTAMELCNAVVHCLRESVQDTVQSTPLPILYEVAKAYFLLGVFRAFRGDMARYFKYRRVCLTYLSKLDVSTKYKGTCLCCTFACRFLTSSLTSLLS